jgi:hypothetical protein
MPNSVTRTDGQTTIQVDQGSYFEHTFVITENDNPFDLDLYTARMQIRRSYGNTSTIYSATLANGKLVKVSPSLGQLKVIFSAEDFASTQFGNKEDDTLEGVFDLEIEEISTAKVYKIAAGSVTIYREVTR